MRGLRQMLLTKRLSSRAMPAAIPARRVDLKQHSTRARAIQNQPESPKKVIAFITGVSQSKRRLS